MSLTVELYETCFGPESPATIMRDEEIVEFSISCMRNSGGLRAVAILFDQDLRNSSRFGPSPEDSILLSTSRDFFAEHRESIARASYCAGHLSVMFFPRDIVTVWDALLSKRVVLEETCRRCAGPGILDAVRDDAKLLLLSDASRRCAGDWFSFWHDAQYVVRSVDRYSAGPGQDLEIESR